MACINRFIFLTKNGVLLLLIHTYCCLNAQKVPNISSLNVNDGLSQGMILDLLQNKDGFIWIATKDGLNRFDGSRFEVFVPNAFNTSSIGDSEVKSIFEDSRGWIWIMLPFGLDVLDPTTGQFFHVKHQGKSLYTSNKQPSIIESSDGHIWFADNNQIWKITVSDQLLANARKKSSFTIEPICKAYSMNAVEDWSNKSLTAEFMLFTFDKKMLIGTNDGLFQFDTKKEKFLPYLPKSKWLIRGLNMDTKGNLLVIAKIDNQVIWIFIDKQKVQYFKDPNIYPTNTFTFSKDGFLWTFRNSLIQKWNVFSFFNNGKPEIEIKASSVFGIESMGVTKYMLDKSGLLWAGTNGYGIGIINDKKKNFRSYLPKVSQRQFLEAPDGGIFSMFYAGQKYPSINFQKASSHKDFVTLFKGNESNAWGGEFTCFDDEGNGWTTYSDSILHRMDALTKAVKSYTLPGFGITADGTNAIYKVSENGLWRFDPKTEKTTKFPFDKVLKKTSLFSHFLYVDVDHNIWIFGLEGLTKATRIDSGYKFEYYTNNSTDLQSISSNAVHSVVDDPINPKKYLWVGTKAGLNRLDKQTGKFVHFQREQGLPDNVVYGILSENQSKDKKKPIHIWLSTNKGLCRFNVNDFKVRNFNVDDGLQANEFNSSSYYKTRDGHMIFGGVNGVTVFHPDSLILNDIVPRTCIVGLQVNNKIYNKYNNGPIYLSHKENLINIEFAALEYTNPRQNQYRYQLLGVDKNWVDLGYKNNVQFANLAPGNYTFKVIGSNNDGLWSKEAAVLRFTIKSPWYATWWAYLIYISALGFIIRHYYKQKLSQKLELQETAKLREMDEFKSRFFTNITHEFRTPLTVILGMSDQLINQEKDQDIKKKIGLIRRNGDNLLRLVNQIMDLSKLESNSLKLHYIQGDVLSYIKYIVESLHSLANAQNIMLRVESDQAKIVMDYDADRLLQMLYNLLSNAIKFTPSGGKVIVRADVFDHLLHISVADTGVGIPEEDLPQLFQRFYQAKNQMHAKAGGSGIGLSLTKEMAKAMGGSIEVESNINVGSKFLIKLPITNKASKEENFINKDNEINRVLISRENNIQSDIENIGQSTKSDLPHILLVEDNPDVVEYLTSCLHSSFYIDYAFNGQAGIEKAIEIIPDIIISDVMMPIKDGFDLLDNLKNDEKTSHIPIVLLTAKADIESRLSGLRKGADAYLSKPFHQEELIATVENLLESRRVLQQKYQQNTWLVSEIKDEPMVDIEDVFLQRFRAVVHENLSDANFEMVHLERALAMSRSQIYRKIKALTDKSPTLLIRSIRLHHGRHLLLTTSLTVSEIAYQVGYSAINNFSDAYLEEFGERPLKTRS